MSKTFQLKEDITFEAEDIDDALTKLGSYYINLSQGGEPESFFISGNISLSSLE